MNARAAHMPPSAPPAPINWTMIAVLLSILISLGGVTFASGVDDHRLARLEQDVQPLRDGDLRALQQDVAWIRRHLEREAVQ